MEEESGKQTGLFSDSPFRTDPCFGRGSADCGAVYPKKQWSLLSVCSVYSVVKMRLRNDFAIHDFEKVFVTRNKVKRGWRYCDGSEAAILVFFVAEKKSGGFTGKVKE